MTRKLIVLLLVALLVGFAAPVFAQESAVKGNLSGTIYDTTGAVVVGAKVTLAGPIGSKTIESDSGGNFMFPLLTPGFYSVKVERQGFKISEVKAVEIATNKTTAIRVTLEPGAVSEVVEVSAPAVTVDTSSTAVGANLTDSFYSQVPTTRNITGLFYVAPGAVSSGGAGAANPSISGGSGLENQYVADGVNVTDGAFGGIGVFSRVYGSLATGINLSFIQEVQVKSGGFEPQYGKSTGGIVQIVTKSGTNTYHGAVSAYFQPSSFEAARVQADQQGNFNQIGLLNHNYGYDISGEIGGYVPYFKDKLFFFGSFNPSWTRSDATFADLHNVDPMPDIPGQAQLLGSTTVKQIAYNYAAKLTWKINANHTLEGSVFGDPTRTPFQPNIVGAPGLATYSETTFDKLSLGTRNVVVRYNGTLSPTWLVNASGSWGHNYLSDIPLNPEMYAVASLTGRDPRFFDPILGANVAVAKCGTVEVPCSSTGQYSLQGLYAGFLENTEGDNYGFEVDTQKSFKFLGDHTFSIGYKLDRNFYDGRRERTGAFFPIPLDNAFGQGAAALYGAGNVAALTGVETDWAGQLRRQSTCTACPLMMIPGRDTPQHVAYLQTRGEFGNPNFLTSGTYHAIYGMDSWSPWKYLTINAGLRWEQQYIQGTMNPAVGFAPSYTWVGNWSPRIGVIVDPWGDRKTKVYVNYGHYNYAIPLDMAIRSLSNELDYVNTWWAPTFQGQLPGVPCGNPCNQFVAYDPNNPGLLATPTFDAAHLVNDATDPLVDPTCLDTGVSPLGGMCGSPSVGFSSTVAIAPGTKMESLDEWVIGFEHDFGHGVIFSARYIDRRMKRIVEDMAGLSPEAYQAGLAQQYFIANPSPTTDLFVNPIQIAFDPADPIPAQCIDETGAVPYAIGVVDTFGNPIASPPGSTNTSVCIVPQFGPGNVANYINGHAPGDTVPDGIPEGFVQPVRNYQAFELEVNKSFSRNWLLRSNYRFARLKGNYEGAFRNDNGQTDPSISSLFDFTAGNFNLLGDQFAIGYLNTDRRHVVNTYFSYVFDKYFLKGLTLGTGVRVQTGVPINDLKAHPAYLNAGEIPVGGRGALGRIPTTGQVDIHAEYAFGITEKSKLHFGVDMFNIANLKRLNRLDEREDRSFGVPNADFKQPRGFGAFQSPFYARMMVKWEF